MWSLRRLRRPRYSLIRSRLSLHRRRALRRSLLAGPPAMGVPRPHSRTSKLPYSIPATSGNSSRRTMTTATRYVSIHVVLGVLMDRSDGGGLDLGFPECAGTRCQLFTRPLQHEPSGAGSCPAGAIQPLCGQRPQRHPESGGHILPIPIPFGSRAATIPSLRSYRALPGRSYAVPACHS